MKRKSEVNFLIDIYCVDKEVKRVKLKKRNSIYKNLR